MGGDLPELGYQTPNIGNPTPSRRAVAVVVCSRGLARSEDIASLRCLVR